MGEDLMEKTKTENEEMRATTKKKQNESVTISVLLSSKTFIRT